MLLGKTTFLPRGQGPLVCTKLSYRIAYTSLPPLLLSLPPPSGPHSSEPPPVRAIRHANVGPRSCGSLSHPLARVRLQRFSRQRHIHQRYGSRYSISSTGANPGKPRMIDSYRGVRDAQRILRLTAAMDFPFLFTKSLEFALFRTYGIPTISSLLVHTGQLGSAQNAGRRYVDTSGLIQAFTTYPLPKFDLPDGGESDAARTKAKSGEENWELFGEDPLDPRASIALARVNFLHARWRTKISNNDLLCTLSTFVSGPITFINRYEWRQLSDVEKEAIFSVFYHIGRCMGITNIPDSLEAFMEWSEEYEKTHMLYTKQNQEVADHTVNLLLYNVPKALHGFAKDLVSSLMDERLRSAMGYSAAPGWVVALKDTLLKLRAVVTATLLLPRSKPLSNVPIAADEAGNVFSVENLLDSGIPSICPASGARAGEGKMCPVGGHLHAQQGQDKENGFKPAAWRMEFKWYENEPVYSRPFAKGSAGWVAEEVRIALGLLKKEDRRGASKWLPPTLPSKKQDDGQPVQGLGGFRLEEMGPKGLELKGRKEVLAEAEKLFGGKIEGKWAFKP